MFGWIKPLTSQFHIRVNDVYIIFLISSQYFKYKI